MKRWKWGWVVVLLVLSVTTAQGDFVAPDGTFVVDGVEIAFHKQGSTVTLPDLGGYDSYTTTVLLRDTWTQGPHSMTWGGAYDGPDHYGVTVLAPAPEPATIAMLGLGSLFLRRRRRA